jgi:hypothetical protein
MHKVDGFIDKKNSSIVVQEAYSTVHKTVSSLIKLTVSETI